MDSLAWFAGGNFILGGMVTANQTLLDFGLSIADAAGAIYQKTTTGLGPEFVAWDPTCEGSCDPDDALQIADPKFRLRPEVLETWYYAYRATKNPIYREWSWAAFEAIIEYCRTDSGFSAIKNVNAADGGGKMDVQESFVFAEVMKYVYLTQLEVRIISARKLPRSLANIIATCRMTTPRSTSRIVGRAKRILGFSTRKPIP